MGMGYPYFRKPRCVCISHPVTNHLALGHYITHPCIYVILNFLPTHPHHRGGGTMTMGGGEGGTQNPEHIFDGVVSRLNSWCISFWYSLRDSYLHCLIWEPKSYWSMPMAGLRVLTQGNGKQSILTSLADLAVDVRCVGFWNLFEIAQSFLGKP